MADDVRDLMVRVDASVALLRAHLNGEGEQSLNRFEAAARKTAASVDRSIEEMGDRFGPFAEMAKSAAARAEESFEKSFSAIEKMAAKAIQAPAGRVDIGAAEARQAAQEAQQKAAAFRLIEQNAIRAAAGQGELTEETRLFIAAAGAARIEAERHAADLAREAGALDRLEMEMQQAGAGAELLAQRQGQLTRISGSTRAGMQQLSYNLNDVAVQASLATPPLMIFSMQFPQMIQAVQMMAGESKGLIGILGGPWGMAFTTALAVGAPVVTMLLQGNDALEKNIENLKKDARETELADRAKKAFTQTIDGQTAALRALNEQLDRQLVSQRQIAMQNLLGAQGNLALSEGMRPGKQAEIAAQERVVQAAREQLRTAEPEMASLARTALAQAEQRLTQLRAELAQIEGNITGYRVAIGKAQGELIRGEVDAKYKQGGAAARSYAAEIDVLNRRLMIAPGKTETVKEYDVRTGTFRDRQMTGISPEAYRREYDRISAAQRKAEEEARRAKSDARANRETGRTISSADAAAIVRGIGGQVNSADRSTARQQQLYDAWVAAGRPADNPVAKPGTSAHEHGNALDVQFGPGISPATLRKAFSDAGVELTKVFKERGHYHVEWAKGQSQEAAGTAAARKAQAAQDAMLADQISFASEERTARRRLIEAQKRSAETDEQRTQLALEDIESEYAAQKTKIAAQQQRGDISQAEADRLNQLNRETAMQRSRNVQAERAVRLIEAGYEAEAQSLEGRLAELRIQADMAVSLKERRKVAAEMLAIEQEMRRRALERVRDTSQDPQEVARAMSALQQLPAIQALEQQRSEQQNAGAWATMLREARADAADFADILEGEAVDAARQLKSELAQAAIRGGSLGDALENSVDRFLEKLIELSLNDAFLLLTGQKPSSSGFFAGIGSMFGKNDWASGVQGGSSDLLGLGALFGGARANGGPVSPGSWYMVGERGPEPFIPRVPGTILPNSALRGGGQPVAIELHLDEGALFEPRVRAISSGVTASIAKKGTRKASLDSRQSLEGR